MERVKSDTGLRSGLRLVKAACKKGRINVYAMNRESQ